MTDTWPIPDPISFLEGLLPGNIFAGEPPLPRGLIALLEDSNGQANRADAEVEVSVAAPMEIREIPSLIEKPGCTAAETTILTLGFLEGLADGYGGFGVLRQGKEYLEKGARAAQFLGHSDVAHDLRNIAAELLDVHDPEQARLLAERLRPLKAVTWEMGRKCKGSLSPEAVRQARQLAEQVRLGQISFQQAVRQVRGAENA